MPAFPLMLDGLQPLSGMRPLNLFLQQGDALVLGSGPGQGKTTLLKSIMGLHTPAAGRSVIFDETIQDLNEQQLDVIRTKIGYLPYDGFLLSNLSLEDNLLLPLRYHRPCSPQAEVRQAKQALARVGLESIQGAKLGRAFRRRVALARCLILEPQLLLLDEPTHDMDTAGAEALWRILEDVRKQDKVAILAVTKHPPPKDWFTHDRIDLTATDAHG